MPCSNVMDAVLCVDAAQMWYTNKNNMVNGEVTVGKAEKLNVTFTQQQLLNAKYTIPDVSGGGGRRWAIYIGQKNHAA